MSYIFNSFIIENSKNYFRFREIISGKKFRIFFKLHVEVCDITGNAFTNGVGIIMIFYFASI